MSDKHDLTRKDMMDDDKIVESIADKFINRNTPPLSSTASKNRDRGDYRNVTLFQISQMLMREPAQASDQEILERNESLIATGFAPIWSEASAIPGMSDLMGDKFAAQVESLEIEGNVVGSLQTSDSSSGVTPTAPGVKGSQNLTKILETVGLNVRADKVKAASGSFAPVGIMLHHTAGVGDGMVELVKNGRSDLPGPLCNALLRPDGEWVVITDGKANDSGMGSGTVLEQIKKGVRQTEDAGSRGLKDSVGGNEFFYDIEVEHVGTHGRYPEAQISSLTLGVAALLKSFGWNVNQVLHHRQWTSRKIDMSYRGNIWKQINDRLKQI